MKFRKKPDTVDALQYGDALAVQEMIEWTKGSSSPVVVSGGVPSIGIIEIKLGDWIVRDEHGNHSIFKPDLFAARYERDEP